MGSQLLEDPLEMQYPTGQLIDVYTLLGIQLTGVVQAQQIEGGARKILRYFVLLID